MELLRRARTKLAQENRRRSASINFTWFRAGYTTALDDIERTGLRPMTNETKREAADEALGRWIDTGSLDA